jgi:endonuclease G
MANPQSRQSYYRSLAARRTSSGTAETVNEGMGDAPELKLSAADIQDRTSVAWESLRKFIETYYGNDPNMLLIAQQIVKEGGDALRRLADNVLQAEQVDGLEAIVRTDGTRPSFLVRNDEVVIESSPIGDWGDRLQLSESALRQAVACVGRIDVPGTTVGYMGTGFLVQENLLITNRHVLQVSANQAADGTWKFKEGAAVDFGHELNGVETVNRRTLSTVLFAGSKEIIFNSIDHKKLDLALIELAPSNTFRAPRDYLSLLARPDFQMDAQIFTIGYPGSPPFGQYTPTLLEQLFQKTFGYKRLAPGQIMQSQQNVAPWTVTHDATTLGGCSGSTILVAGREGLAAGLHYGGRTGDPRENWGHVLIDVLGQTDGKSSRTLGEILTSRGVKVQESTAPTRPTDTAPAPVFASDVPDRIEISPVAPTPKKPETSWRQGMTLAAMRPLVATEGKSRAESAALEAAGDGETAATSFAGRSGYDPDFLTGWNIPLPMPTGNDARSLRRGGTGVELKYEHFSVIMSKSRRMPIITACNINGQESRRLPRVSQWNYDGRLDQDDQWGNELYVNNDVDRGHQVRREDPVWGTPQTAKRANVDTFHYTNSCPQMAGVNQVIWLGLENYVLDHTRDDEMKVSVFTGPIFTDHDMEYRGALIPKAFWKVVAFQTDDGRPSATAYRVSQARELEELEFVFAGYKTFQISIQAVMDATGIDFSALIPFDGFSQHERVHGVVVEEQLESLSQIRV